MNSWITRISLGLVVVLNGLLAYWRIFSLMLESPAQSDGFTDYSTLKYSYEEYNYPLQLPQDHFGRVALTLQGSSRLALNFSDPVAQSEWPATLAGIEGYGRLRLGPERRLFLTTWWHQLHCLGEIQKGLLDNSKPEATLHHLTHCFTYLRQTFLCDANGALEDGDFFIPDYSQTNYLGDSMVCYHWPEIHRALAKNSEDFEKWGKEWL